MKASYTRPFLGLIIIGIGLGFLLDTLNIWDFSSIISQWWPLIIIAAGVLSLVSNPRVPLWPGVVIATGVLLLLRQLNILDFNVWQLIWPALLVVLGISLLTDKFGKGAVKTAQDQIDLFAAFSGNENINSSDDFRGGKITALFGGVSLDLRNAKLKDTARIDIFTAFGGTEIKVPEDWNVKTSGVPIFGGWENKAKSTKGAGAPTLEIQGTCLFGGIEIKN